jgi:V/A-type H+-transporting ATPase subunit C
MFDDKYLYAVTRIRALETKLLDKSKIERMVDTKNAEEVVRVLAETEYASLVSEMSSALDYETLLLKELERTYAFLREIAPSKGIAQLFLIKYDIHNLKVLLKSNMLGEENDELLINIGSIPVNRLKEMVKEKNFNDFDPIIGEALKSVLDNVSVTPDPQLIDLVLDKSQYEIMYNLAKQSKSSFMMDFISAQIDMVNIRSFLRIRIMGFGRDYLTKVIFLNGKLGLDFYSKYFDEPLESIAEKLWATDYYKVIQEGLESFAKTKSFTKLERLIDDYILEFAKKGKYVAFGIEPIIGYLMAKENEAKLIRIIMVGKINDIPNEIIRERLRDVYV